MIKMVYSFIASTTYIDVSSQFGKAFIQQVHPYACQMLCNSKPEFKKLYEQVKKEDSPHMLGTGMAATTANYHDAFIAWLSKQGVSLSNLAPLLDKRIFLFAGNAQEPQSGANFDWCVFIYIE